MCQGDASFSQHIYGYYLRINQFLLSERTVFHCKYKSLKEKQLPTDRKNSSQILIIFGNKKLKKLRAITVQSKISDVSFSIDFCFETKLDSFFTRRCTFHIAIFPHIFLIYIDTRSIVERTPHSQIQHYFCHKHDAHERILSVHILFSILL